MGLTPELAATVMFSFFFFALVIADGEKISNREYLAMKRQIRSLRKPGVKVIKTKYGDIYDCVDIHKQPSLDHPLLKNHTVQMAPTNYMQAEVPKKDVSKSGVTSVDISLPDGGCPKGTVPIKRLTVDDLIMGRAMRRMKRKHFLQRVHNNHSTNANDGFQHHYAIIKTPIGWFHGFSARLNVWQPGAVQFRQSSISQMWLTGGPFNNVNFIEAGWMVNPMKYRDSRVYLFTFWTSDSYRNGCYDMECQGFIHTSPRINLPSYLEPLSVYNGTQQQIVLQINRDSNTGHWWVKFGDDHEPVGYWPSGLLPHLRGHASEVQWGGEVAGLCNLFPPMGSGRFAQEDFKKACYMSNIKMVDRSGNLVDVPNFSHSFMSDSNCFNVLDYLPGGNNPMGRHIYFGGPGGLCGTPCM